MTTEQTDPNLQDGFFRQHAKHQAAKATENIQAVMFVAQLCRFLVRVHSYPGYILLRRNFGERFLPTGIILLSSMTCLLAAAMAASTTGMTVGIGIFLIACIHRIQIMRRNKRGEIWHSYDDGTSYLDKKFPDHAETIESVGEPALVMAAGLVLTQFTAQMPSEQISSVQFFWSSAFGLYVITVGVAMMLQANKLKCDARNLFLDSRDSQIDNQDFAAIQDRDMQDTEVDALLNQSGIARAV